MNHILFILIFVDIKITSDLLIIRITIQIRKITTGTKTFNLPIIYGLIKKIMS